VTLPGDPTTFAGQASAPLPGPVNRSTFFEQQERNRTATWRLTLLCVFTVFCTGMILSLVLAPPIYGLAALALTLAKKYGSVSPQVWHAFQQGGTTFVAILNHFGNRPMPLPPLGILVYAAVAILLPGMVIQLVLWLGIRALYLRAGAGGVLLTLGARAPRLEDLQEKKLVDVVEEMAIAGGVPSPKVMLLDSTAGNAAVVGSSRQDATLVVSRRLVEHLDRDEMQAVVGHLIASAGNGDLHIAMTTVSVYQAFGLLDALVNSPFGPRSRRTLWRLVRMTFRRGGAAEADEVSELLTEGLRDSGKDDVTASSDKLESKSGCLSTLMLPVIMFNASLKITMMVLSGLLFAPAAAVLWRTRRYLADATAVQLTRNPDALANALQSLRECGGLIPGGKWASHLFIVGQEAGGGMPPEMARRIRDMRKSGVQPTRENMLKLATEAMARGDFASMAGNRAARKETLEEATGGSMVSLHPPLEKRLKRLQMQGAHYAAGGRPHRKSLFFWLFLLLFVTPLALMALAAILAAVAMCILLNFFFVILAFAVILAIIRLIP
jgi:Zn-dependent protease with chaperone function